MPPAVLNERALTFIENFREVLDVSRFRRDRKVNEQQAQNRLDADAACRHMQVPFDRSCWDVHMREAPQAGVAAFAFRMPVPGDQLPVRFIQEVISVRCRAHVPALPAVLDDFELVAEHELDKADAGRVESQGIFRQCEGFHVARALAS
jgi:hypothetical protein